MKEEISQKPPALVLQHWVSSHRGLWDWLCPPRPVSLFLSTEPPAQGKGPAPLAWSPAWPLTSHFPSPSFRPSAPEEKKFKRSNNVASFHPILPPPSLISETSLANTQIIFNYNSSGPTCSSLLRHVFKFFNIPLIKTWGLQPLPWNLGRP